MIRMRPFRAACWLALLGAALAIAPAARANIIAAVEQPAGGSRTDLDIALYDATTGTRLSLPSSVNTTDDELHPSLTPDGRRLVFERSNATAGTHRIVIVDTSTGVSADLFSGFEAAQVPPATPAISADGKTVVTGRPNVTNGNFHHLITSTDVSSFPSTTTGPFPHQTIDPGSNGVGTGQTLELALGPNGLVAYEVRVSELVPGLGVTTLGGSGPECGLDDGDAELSQPAFAASSTDYMLYTRRSLPGAVHPGDIWFAPLEPNSQCKVAVGTKLPPIVDTSSQDESRPALTPDGRYVGFVRHQSDSNGHSVLFIWDSLTQTLVNNTGVDLGVLNAREIDLIAARGNLSIRQVPVLHLTVISPVSGFVSAQLLVSASIGILVQRVVGHHRVLGRRAPKLQLIGRVPLGHFKRGRARVHWDHKVNGHVLRPGLYQVTVRALAKNGRIEDLGQPHLVRIRRTGRHR
jgi:hypothetical protein